MEKSTEKLKDKITLCSSNSTLGCIYEGNEITILKRYILFCLGDIDACLFGVI
jgi:hypothetical protein